MTATPNIGNIMTDEKEHPDISFDLFSLPQFESDMIDSKTIKIKPVAGAATSTGPFEFILPSQDKDYTLLPFTRLEGQVRVVKSNGDVLTGSEDLSVTNLFTTSLFRQIECSVNNTEVIDQSVGCHAYKAYLETLLTYGKDAKDTHLKTQFWMKDHGKVNANAKTDNSGKSGYVDRQKMIESSKIVNFSQQLHIDFFNTRRLLPPGLSVKLRLLRNDDNFSLIAKTGSYKIEIIPHSLSLSLRKITPSLEIQKKHMQLLESGRNMFFPYQQTKIVTNLVSAGSQSIYRNICNGPLPSQIFMVMVDHAAFNSDVTQNPFFFQHFKMTNFRFIVNGQSQPSEYFKPNFDNGNYLREYRNLIDCLGICFNNGSVDITPEEFKDGYFIMAYDACPELCGGERKHLPKTGSIDFEMDLKEALAKPITILAYMVFEKVLEVNGGDKSCTVKYLT